MWMLCSLKCLKLLLGGIVSKLTCEPEKAVIWRLRRVGCKFLGVKSYIGNDSAGIGSLLALHESLSISNSSGHASCIGLY